MGDISEMRGIIIIFGFISSFLLLMLLIPTEMYASPYGTSYIPENVDPNSFIAWNSTHTFNITSLNDAWDIAILGWNIRLYSYYGFIRLTTYNYFTIFEWGFNDFRWYKNGNDITYYWSGGLFTSAHIEVSQIQEDENTYGDLSYVCKNDYTTFSPTFAYNTTKWDNVTEAYNNLQLSMILTVDWNERNTGMSAFGLISSLLTFSIPAPYPINILLAAPFWGAIAYMIFIFLLRIVGSVFGGGGA
jgi:hypothetical protein